MKKSITINEDRCIGCGMCVKDCFMQALELDDNKHPRYVAGGKQMCVGCQHCMVVCPKAALSFGDKNPDECQPIVQGNDEELLGVIRSRRSVRNYRQQDVPAEKLEKICQMLAAAPTGANIQDLHFSIVSTKAKMDEIRDAVYKEIMALESDNPFIGMVKQTYSAGIDLAFRGAPSMVVATVNKSLAVQACDIVDPTISLAYLDLYAHSLGLGTLWDDLGLFVFESAPKARKLLQIPEGYDIAFVMLLGIPATKYKRAPQHEPVSIAML